MNIIKSSHIWLLLVATVMLFPTNLYAADKEKTYRYAERPWGIDSAAGRCVVCHSLEENGPHRVAPNLWGIIGAKKAAKGWYNYSSGLRAKGGVWTENEMDEFLADANKFALGSTKSIRVNDSVERKAIIDFLKKLQ